MGLGIRIMLGVRLSASSRGLRMGLGPLHRPSARGHRTPIRLVGCWPGHGVAGRRPTQAIAESARGTSRASLAAYERQARQAERMEEIVRLVPLEWDLVSVHRGGVRARRARSDRLTASG